MSEIHRGKVHNEEARNKISASAKDMWENKKQSVRIYNCIVCGQQKETYSLNKKLKYCSNACCKKDIRSKNDENKNNC